jgi:hypothetical protein
MPPPADIAQDPDAARISLAWMCPKDMANWTASATKAHHDPNFRLALTQCIRRCPCLAPTIHEFRATKLDLAVESLAPSPLSCTRFGSTDVTEMEHVKLPFQGCSALYQTQNKQQQDCADGRRKSSVDPPENASSFEIKPRARADD